MNYQSVDQLQKFFVSPETALIAAMRVINDGASQIALVVDERQFLLGTITDGDIRRGLLQGLTLETPVEQVMNRDFHFVRNRNDEAKILEIMRHNKLSQIPVLDLQGCVTEILLLKNLLLPPQQSNAVVVMAGGKGTRLGLQTKDCPKPMLKVGAKPILQIILEQCISSGYVNFYFSVNYLKEQIIDYFSDGSKWGVSIKYLVENQPLGTAGSLKLLPDSVQEPFLVLNGDVLTRLSPVQLLQFHDQHQAAATICVREHELSVPFGVVETTGIELSSFQEKPTYRHMVNAGVYVIDPCLLGLLPRNQSIDMPSLLQLAKQSGHRVTVCPVHEYWLDVGRPETLLQAHREWPAQENL